MSRTLNRITLALGGPLLLAGVLGSAIAFAQEGTETPTTAPEESATPAPDESTTPEDTTTPGGTSPKTHGRAGCDKDGTGSDSESDGSSGETDNESDATSANEL
ncbi:MAG: hypothetical protein ACSLFM_02725 [Tepidiformaceae bacterium]